MIILYGTPASVFVRKALILLLEKKLDFKIDPINLYDHITEEFKQASPLHKIPAFQDDDFSLADSSAICAYLDKKYPNPKFYPDQPEQYAKALWFEEYADTELFQAVAPCYYQTVLVPLYKQKAADLAAINTALTEKLPTVATYLETELKGKEFFVGNHFTIADVAIVTMFMNMYLSGYPLDAAKWPQLHQYLRHHFERESFLFSRKYVTEVLAKLNSSHAMNMG